MGKQREYYLIDGYNVINAWPELKPCSKTFLRQGTSLCTF